MEWSKILFVIGAALAAWLMWRVIRGNPAAFSRSNLGKSFFTMGILALVLFAFVALLVMLVRS